MARGLAKQQAKAKAAKLTAKRASKQVDQKAARAKQLKMMCVICRAPMSDVKVYKSHFMAKHPKLPLPDELK